ncbi:MAG: N-acetylglutaminylglutamine amidotransferase [Thiotrichaceae bacterium]|nr:N-acetylglutaminylglutamine amidotransferase [Thiotrichaceae bacterium]
MCGICGELRFDGSLADLAGIDQMMRRLESRGPDHAGSFSDGSLAFGHRRLSILDLTEKANQPMIDTDLSLALVFNGTIYNHPELRKTLEQKGHHFSSTGDTEVILKAYAQWGKECVKRFQGMFAFAIWDLKEKILFVGRDRLGIKPVYYHFGKNGFAFASNTQALLTQSGVDTDLDPAALHNLFSLHAVVPAPRTILKGIRKLEPGHTLTLTQGGESKLECYWTLSAKPSQESCDEQEWIGRIHEALKIAVKRRNNIADVPVGVLLSGGLDSSLLVALLDEVGVNDIRTFTIGFDDQPEEKGNEYEFSDAVVERFKTQHHKVHIPNEMTLQRLPEAVANMSEPMFGQDAIGFYLLSEQVAKDVKVVQSGQGADEVFGGYFWYPEMQKSFTASDDALMSFRQHYFDRDHDEMTQLLTPEYIDRDFTSELMKDLLETPHADSFIDAVLRADTTTLIVDDPVKRVDNMTMAWGLEARVPFLDHELVELAAMLPIEMKLRDQGKYILKKIARGRVPDSVIDRPKGYFPVPALKFVRGEFLSFMQDILNSQQCRERGIYQRAYIDKLLANPESHLTRIKGSKLWHLTLLEFWLQTNGL